MQYLFEEVNQFYLSLKRYQDTKIAEYVNRFIEMLLSFNKSNIQSHNHNTSSSIMQKKNILPLLR